MKSPLHYISRFRETFKNIQTGLGGIQNELARNQARQRINMAVARGGASAALRRIDPTEPASWEFSGFSQNGEDGIIDYLLSNLAARNRYFIEIGASNGLENNTSWLALVGRCSGIMVEGDQALSQQCVENFTSLNWGLQIVNARVTRESIRELMELSLFANPDLLSLDIDGIDYYVAKEMLDRGLRPKVFVVEYNSAFGPDASITVNYKRDFDISKEHPKRLYYGVSISGWKCLMTQHGYQFITVDQNGINAFFVDPKEFAPNFVKNIEGTEFRENFAQRCRHRMAWQGQYELIKDCSFVQIE